MTHDHDSYKYVLFGTYSKLFTLCHFQHWGVSVSQRSLQELSLRKWVWQPGGDTERPCRLLKGKIEGAAEIGSKMDTWAIMQAREIKAARLKDKSAMKSVVQLYEGDWQVIDKKKT